MQRGADGETRKAMSVKNVVTQAQRRLYRKISLNGPFHEIVTKKWHITDPEDSEAEVDVVNDHISEDITRCVERAQADQVPVAEAISIKNMPHVIYVDPR
jgi:hypothetical protein